LLYTHRDLHSRPRAGEALRSNRHQDNVRASRRSRALDFVEQSDVRNRAMNLQTRVRDIITKPASEWREVAAESTTVGELMTGYAMPLTAIPAICGFIGLSMVGISTPFTGPLRISFLRGISNAIIGYVLGLVSIYVAAIVVEKLAPTFQSRGNTTQAMKLVVFASTPIWVAGVLQLIPALSVLTILAGLYAIYLFYLGLPHVMHTPQDKVIPYMLVAAVIIIVLSVSFTYITGVMTGVRGFTY
jgi:hypothetical protein